MAEQVRLLVKRALAKNTREKSSLLGKIDTLAAIKFATLFDEFILGPGDNEIYISNIIV